jgi:hypothetical protein
MIKRALIFSVLSSIIFSTAAHGGSICLENAYSGNLYNGKGVSFRVRACYPKGIGCSAWGSWDWLKRGRSRVFRHSDASYLDVQVNFDGDNTFETKSLTLVPEKSESECDKDNTWHFYKTKTGNIWLFIGPSPDSTVE